MGSGLVRKIPDRAWSPLGNCRWWDQKVSWLGGHADTARADKPSAHWPVMTLTLPSSPPFSSSSPHPHAEARRSGTLGMGDISLPWLTPTSRRPSLVKKEKKQQRPSDESHSYEFARHESMLPKTTNNLSRADQQTWIKSPAAQVPWTSCKTTSICNDIPLMTNATAGTARSPATEILHWDNTQ